MVGWSSSLIWADNDFTLIQSRNSRSLAISRFVCFCIPRCCFSPLLGEWGAVQLPCTLVELRRCALAPKVRWAALIKRETRCGLQFSRFSRLRSFWLVWSKILVRKFDSLSYFLSIKLLINYQKGTKNWVTNAWKQLKRSFIHALLVVTRNYAMLIARENIQVII